MGYTKQSLIKKSKLSKHKHTQKIDFQFTQSNELFIRIEVFLLQNSNYKINTKHILVSRKNFHITII